MAVLSTFARMCVENLDDAVRALESIGVCGVRLRFQHPTGLEIALVGNVLVLSGTPEMLESFRSTDVTVIVDDLVSTLDHAVGQGATVIRGPAEQAVGRNATVRFPAGPTIEFVEWNQSTREKAGLPSSPTR